MSYPTQAYPEWRSLSPKVHNESVPEFVEDVNSEVRYLFDTYSEVHLPERDALRYCKGGAVYMAVAIDELCDDLTIGEIAGADDEEYREMAEDRGVADQEVTAEDVAYAAYANRVWRRDWAEEKTDLDPGAFIFLHDGLREYEEMGKEIWNERMSENDGEGDA